VTAAPGSMGYMGWLGRLRDFLRWFLRLGARVVNWAQRFGARVVNWARRLGARVANWLRKLTDRIRDRYRDRNKGLVLSGFEAWLNRLLWFLFWIGLVYALLHKQVILANVSERFRGGPRFGALWYDLSIAYIGAFVFYLLNIRVPLRRDRRKIYRHIGPQVGFIIDDAAALMTTLNKAADVTPVDRKNTWQNVQQTCSRTGPNSPVLDHLVVAGPVPTFGTVFDVIVFRMDRTRAAIREILGFSSYLASDLVDRLVVIETHSHFRNFGYLRELRQRGQGIGNSDLSAWWKSVFDYLRLIDDLDRYAQKHLRTSYEPRPGLVASTERLPDDSVVPLQRLMNG
jgi:hypothetical protein